MLYLYVFLVLKILVQSETAILILAFLIALQYPTYEHLSNNFVDTFMGFVLRSWWSTFSSLWLIRLA